MAVRPIDGNELYRIEKLLDTDIVRQDKVALNLLEQVLYDIQHVPTLTPPDEPLTFAQLCEMDGNPVFAVIGGIEPLKMWTLIEFVEEAHCVILTNNLGGRTEYYSDKELKEDGLTIYRYPPKREKNASPDLISRSALLKGETEPEIITGSDSELAEHMEWDRWMDKIKRAPAVGKEEES